MADAVTCPVCNGTGRVKKDSQEKLDRSVSAIPDTTCYGCNGKGWVEVGS